MSHPRSASRACGIHAATSILTNRPESVSTVLLSRSRKDQRIGEIERLAKSSGVKCSRVPIDKLNRLARGIRHQGVVVLCDERQSELQETSVDDLLRGLAKPAFVVVFDSVEDPRNLGACIRSANAAGADGAIVPQHRGSAINETVIKTAAGAVGSLPIVVVANLVRALRELKEKGLWIVGLEGAAVDSIFEASFTEPCALVFGSEAAGLRKATRDACDSLASIPMLGDAESYNVSVAVGIASLEVARQRGEVGSG